MVQDPLSVATMFVAAGAARIIVHVETLSEADVARLDSMRATGAEIGIALLLDTPLDVLAPYADIADVLQCMAIERIGYQGEPFQSAALPRVEELHRRYPDIPISVDGGVNEQTISQLFLSGAVRFPIGSAIFATNDPRAAYRALAQVIDNESLARTE